MAQSDSWMREFEDAVRLADDITARIAERNSGAPVGAGSRAAETRLISATRRKITMLGTRLDSLQSLLSNPSLTKSLTEKELNKRQELVLSLRSKMTSSLNSLQASNRAQQTGVQRRERKQYRKKNAGFLYFKNAGYKIRALSTHVLPLWSLAGNLDRLGDGLMGILVALKLTGIIRSTLLGQEGKSSEPAKEDNRTKGLDNAGVVGLQRQIMREQDEDLSKLEGTITSTKHIALAVNEELDLHSKLLDNLDEDADRTTTRLNALQRRLGDLSQKARSGCSVMCLLLMVLVIVILILIIFALIRYL